MNISFYLIPKSDVTYLETDHTTSQALRLLRKKGYQAVPVIDKEGHYVGTISEGDFLWTLMLDYRKDAEAMNNKKIGTYRLKWDYRSVSVDAEMDQLRKYIVNQNFVPVVDGRNVFIGIVTRRTIISALIKQKEEKEKQQDE